jgi:hypothetical protein
MYTWTICASVCLYVFLYVCMYVCLDYAAPCGACWVVEDHTGMLVCMYICMCVYMHALTVLATIQIF